MELLPIHRCGHKWGFGLPPHVLATHKKCHQLQWENTLIIHTVLFRRLCPCFGSLCSTNLFHWLHPSFSLTWIELSWFVSAKDLSLGLQTTWISGRSLLEKLINNRKDRKKDYKKSFRKNIIWSLTAKHSFFTTCRVKHVLLTSPRWIVQGHRISDNILKSTLAWFWYALHTEQHYLIFPSVNSARDQIQPCNSPVCPENLCKRTSFIPKAPSPGYLTLITLWFKKTGGHWIMVKLFSFFLLFQIRAPADLMSFKIGWGNKILFKVLIVFINSIVFTD